MLGPQRRTCRLATAAIVGIGAVKAFEAKWKVKLQLFGVDVAEHDIDKAPVVKICCNKC
jgi:hypothetical protein